MRTAVYGVPGVSGGQLPYLGYNDPQSESLSTADFVPFRTISYPLYYIILCISYRTLLLYGKWAEIINYRAFSYEIIIDDHYLR